MNRRTACRRHQLGFTLTEMLAAVAVMGIGLSLAAPGMDALVRGNRQASAVNDLVATMHLARSEAITRNRRVTVCASADGERCGAQPWESGWIAFVDDDADGERSGQEPLLDRIAALAGQELTSAEFERAFSYRPNGRLMGSRPEDNTGEFIFCEPAAEAAARVVIVRATGMPALAQRHRDGSVAQCRSAS